MLHVRAAAANVLSEGERRVARGNRLLRTVVNTVSSYALATSAFAENVRSPASDHQQAGGSRSPLASAISSRLASPASTWARSAATSRARARSPTVFGSSVAFLSVRISAARYSVGIVSESSSGGIERSPTGATSALAPSPIPSFATVERRSVSPPAIRFPAPPPSSLRFSGLSPRKPGSTCETARISARARARLGSRPSSARGNL